MSIGTRGHALIAAILAGLAASGWARPVPAAEEGPPALFFEESFDDPRLPDRGWYDGRTFAITAEGARSGSCLEYHWEPGTTTPARSSTARRLFGPTESVYVRFAIRLSPGWAWSGRPYHPHLINILTTESGRFQGPARSRLTLYVEANDGKLRLAAQDIENAEAPHGLTQGPIRGGYNGTFHDSREVLLKDDAWHVVEAEFRLNSLDLAADKPRADGVARAWFDGELVVDRTDLVFRTTDYPEMKFHQLLMGPYFGEGLLPKAQTLWIDDLAVGAARPAPGRGKVKVAAAQPANRTIDYRVEAPEALERVDRNLDELERLVEKAGAAGCDALALPEDALGLLNWEAAHPDALAPVLTEAVARMLDRLGKAAATHQMYLVFCSDAIDADGLCYNTAFLIGPDGREIGRYRKVNLPLTEQARARGPGFPVFPTADLGTVGMLICYDMVFPEAARCLSLAGADLIFHPTLGGAAIGDHDISLAAFRTRAVENFVYLVVANRGDGSMIIAPTGEVLATAEGADSLAIAEIDPAGGRRGGDAMNMQEDMRGRLFRERVPSAYQILTDPEPPVLAKVRSNVTREQAIKLMETVLTTGERRFQEAEALARSGKTDEAIRLFEDLCRECPTSWIDRAARRRLETLRKPQAAGPANDR